MVRPFVVESSPKTTRCVLIYLVSYWVSSHILDVCLRKRYDFSVESFLPPLLSVSPTPVIQVSYNGTFSDF